MRIIKFCCCLRHNIEPFCQKQDSLMCGTAAFIDSWIQMTHNLYSTVEMLITCDGPVVIDGKARYWSRQTDGWTTPEHDASAGHSGLAETYNFYAIVLLLLSNRHDSRCLWHKHTHVQLLKFETDSFEVFWHVFHHSKSFRICHSFLHNTRT